MNDENILLSEISLGSLEKDLSTNQSALEIFLEHVPNWLPCNRLYSSLYKLGYPIPIPPALLKFDRTLLRS